MWCVIPAAGQATRLAGHTGGAPKALLSIGDRPLIEHLLGRLGDAVSDVCLVCSPRGREKLEERVGERSGALRIHYAVQDSPLGVADAVGRAAGLVRGPFLVAMGDCFFDAGLGGSIERWSSSGAHGAVFVERADAAGGQAMGLVETSHGRVRRIFKAVWTGQTEWRVCGAFLLPSAFFGALVGTGPASSGEVELEDVVTRLIREGAEFAAIRYGGWRRNINTPEDLDEVRQRLARAELRG